MSPARYGIAAAILLFAGSASAQPAKEARGSLRYRMPALGRAPIGIGEHDPVVALRRYTIRPAGVTTASLRGESRTLAYDAQSRSRVTTMRLEDSRTIGDALEASIGWHALKVSNRNVNATSGGGAGRLTARDWFLPRASLAYRPTSRLALSLGYRETMRAFEGAGSVGPLGLTQGEFDTLRATLRPERAQLLRFDGDYRLHDVRLSLGGFRGRLGDPLDLADRSYRPGNRRSLALSGISVVAEHKMTPQLTWSGYYQRAAGRTSDMPALREEEIGMRGTWTDGAWQGSFRAARAVSAVGTFPGDAMRIEAGVDYTITGLTGRPLTLSAQLSDPSRLASMRAMEESGALRATDRARRFLVQARMIW